VLVDTAKAIKVAISRNRILTARSRMGCPRQLLSQTRPGPAFLTERGPSTRAAPKAQDHSCLILLYVPKVSYVPNRVEIHFAM
jgi:hypothetical protein